jgi:DNA-binding HxlR family transcriptional regulator
MRQESDDVCICPLEGIIDVISKKWALLTIATIGNHRKLRFNQIMKNLEGISPKTLADLLKRLEASGLVQRKVFAEIPPRVEYSLTEDGVELRKAIRPLLEWASTKQGEKYRASPCLKDSS